MNEKMEPTSTDTKPPPDGLGAFPIENPKSGVSDPSTTSVKPKPPFIALFFIPENTIVCSVCKLPGGELDFIDSTGRPWRIKTNTNLAKWTDGSWIHQNREVCIAGKEIRVAPKPNHCEECKKGNHIECYGHKKGTCSCGCPKPIKKILEITEEEKTYQKTKQY